MAGDNDEQLDVGAHPNDAAQLDDAAKLKIENTRVAEFKERLKTLYLQEKHKKEQEYAPVEAEKAKNKKHEDSLGSDGKPLWDKVNEGGYRLIHDNAAGWQEFPNFMMSLVHQALNNAIANWYDPIDITYFIPYRDEIGGVFAQLKDAAVNGAMDFAERRFLLDDKQLANVSFTSKLDEQGKLKVDILVNGEPEPPLVDPKNPNAAPTYPLQDFVEEAVVDWAKIQDYKYDGATNTFKDDNNNTMTDELFKKLNADPENSILKFLSGRFNYALKEEATPPPSPSF
ncbi:MAG: hypothetical protein H0U73_00140 [Tatlockia sp.]|nr:hypothetical protein [Tatlockia sp.]